MEILNPRRAVRAQCEFPIAAPSCGLLHVLRGVKTVDRGDGKTFQLFVGTEIAFCCSSSREERYHSRI